MVIDDKNLAQASVIGAMLLDETLIGPTLAALQPESFLDGTLRRIYLAMRKDFSAAQPVDMVTVLSRLQADGEQGSWAEALKVCMENTPTTANHKAYIKAVQDQARLQRLNNWGMRLAGAVSLDDAKEAVGRINEQLVQRQGVWAMTMEQGLSDFYERLKAKREFLPWGFYGLDSRLYGELGDFILIGGRPSAGKTALGLTTAWAQAEKYRVGFFSLETSDKKVFDRLMARVAKINMARIKHSELDEEDYASLARHAEEITGRGLEVVPAAGMTVDDIFAYAQARRYQIIYIDYVQIIPGDDRNGLVAKNTAISIGLHTHAQDTGIAVVGLAQLSRPGKQGKTERPPIMSDLRESGQYEQDADVIMLLYREKPNDLADGRRRLDVAKNKEGELGALDLYFDGETQNFSRVTDRVAPPPKKGEEKEAEPEWVQTAMEAEEFPTEKTREEINE